MNILLLGKTGGIVHWLEDTAADLRIAGHTVSVISTRNPWLNKSVENVLLSPMIGAPIAVRIARKIMTLSPDLIVAIGGLEHCPLITIQHITGIAGRPPLVAWVGDIFTRDAAQVANLFDIIAYTDTGLRGMHDTFGFRSKSHFVPLGASRATRASPSVAGRLPELAFVAAPTANRRALLARVHDSVAIYGPGWTAASELAQHKRVARRIYEQELADIYAGYSGVLNIHHSERVINGLNQRHFAPYIEATPVVTDPQSDIVHCFDPDSEMLVYHDVDELNKLYAMLRRDAAWAARIGLAGQQRVLACHTYTHRVEAIAAVAGVKRGRALR